MLEMKQLSLQEAQFLVDHVCAVLRQDGRGAAVAVADPHGELIAFARTDGCPLASILIAMNKAFTAARERKESGAVGHASRVEGFPMTNFGDLRYVAWGGGVPVLVDGRAAGALGVSGLPEEEDIALARAAVAALQGTWA